MVARLAHNQKVAGSNPASVKPLFQNPSTRERLETSLHLAKLLKDN